MENDELQIPASLRIASRANRAVHMFTVPEKMQAEIGFATIGLLELTADEEMAVLARTKGGSFGAAVKTQYELAKATLASLNGKVLPAIGEELDAAWNAIPPKGRALLLTAFKSLHNVEKELERDFLKSRTTTV